MAKSWERENLSKMERLLNLFPKKKIKCTTCDKQYREKRGIRKFSKRKYDGPYCTYCGIKIGKV